jgi:hypothetical protein
MTGRLTRRRVVKTSPLALVAGMAGCLDSGDGDTGPEDESESSGGQSTPDEDGEETLTEEVTPTDEDDEETPTDDASTDPDVLDLREANVVGIEIDDSDGQHSFSVTLHHDDDGEEGYANWWQVEQLDGTQLGRRDLTHPHSNQPFTRSASIEIPEEVTCVVVRGHDQTHEYGGVAMLVDIESGATRAVDQGSEPQTFESSDCP